MKKIILGIMLLFLVSKANSQKLNKPYLIDSVTYMNDVDGKQTMGIDGMSAIFSIRENSAYLDVINNGDTAEFKAIQNLEIVAMPHGELKKFLLINTANNLSVEFGLYINPEGNVRGIAFRMEDSVTIFWIKKEEKNNEEE